MSDCTNYNDAVQIIKAAILKSQYRAARESNAAQLQLYYAVGGYVSANTREGKWGQGALASISDQLQKELPGLRGFSERNLYYMKTFYEEWSSVLEEGDVSALASAETSDETVGGLHAPNLDRATREAFFSIGFTLHRTILEGAKDEDERLFYIHKCAQEHLSVAALKRLIRNDEYRHRGSMPNNFEQTLSESGRALQAITTFKDEYLLDFINAEELGARDSADVNERVLEQGIVHNIRNFIMEFGHGFSFVCNNYHLSAFGEDQYVDLLFFNRDLNCLVAVELKRGKFKTAYLGQLSGYLSMLGEFERKPHEAPSIGIVLCKDMNESFVNLVIRSYNSPMGVAMYDASDDVPARLREALPDIGDLKALLAGCGTAG